VPNIKTPEFFPILSLLPQRALVYVKEAHAQKFIQVFKDIFQAMWEQGLDVSKPELLAQVLSKQFSETEVRDILEKANSAPYKQRLNDNTKEALDLGAFGCPWHVLRNSKGEEEPFFGSDRLVFPAFLASPFYGCATRLSCPLFGIAPVVGRKSV
jgi:glutathione S-transferase kappa 1